MGCDRISELPDCLLTQILSYLPTKDSVKTSVLSKRWEFLWLQVSGLDINANDFFPYENALSSFMNRFLEFNRGSSCLQNFKIKYHQYTNYSKILLVMEWIAEVFHRGVQYLDVESELFPRGMDIMPKCVYVSKTLVSLKLVGVVLEDPKFVVSLPCLKILHLKNNYCENCGRVVCGGLFFYVMDYISGTGLLIMKKLISGSPVLENLTMECSYSPQREQVGSFWTNVPSCLSSTLEYVKINQLMMKEENGIKLVNYFLENSAVLKKLSLVCTNSHDMTNQDAESYKKLLTSTKLSPRCQIFFC